MSQFLRQISEWFQSKPQEDQNILQKLQQFWSNQQPGQNISYIAVVFDTSATSDDDIEGMGLSIWSKRGLQDILSYHWRVEENIETKDVTDFKHPDSFYFGRTQSVTAQDFGTILDDWTSSLTGRGEKLCLIVYGKQQSMVLERHFSLPTSVMVVDLEEVLRLRPDSFCPSLEDLVSSASNTLEASICTDHAGNQAYCLVVLARDLEKESQEYKQKQKHPSSIR